MVRLLSLLSRPNLETSILNVAKCTDATWKQTLNVGHGRRQVYGAYERCDIIAIGRVCIFNSENAHLRTLCD